MSWLLNLEIVSSPEDLERGLGGRTYLPEDAGMLFVLQPGDRSPFTMRGMLIPIDFIWLSSRGEVVAIAANVQPPENVQLLPQADFAYVLETNAGFTERNDVRPGDKIEISY